MDQHMNDKKEGQCAVCQTVTDKKCTACWDVYYCCTEHQRADWKQHKLLCAKFEVRQSEELGRYLVATKDIKAKSVVYVEKPIAMGPKWSIDKTMLNPMIPCVGCLTPVMVNGLSCPKCKWPICSYECSGLQDPEAHEFECCILSLRRRPIDFNNLDEALDFFHSDALLVLRCLLLQSKFPKKWKALMNMQDHEEERRGTQYFIEADTRIVSYLIQNYLIPLKKIGEKHGQTLLPYSDEKILHKICGILEVNAMIAWHPNGNEIGGVYPTASLMEHSCIPSCYFAFDVNNNYKLSIVAGRDIKKGEHLSIMYSHMMWGTQTRQDHLKSLKYFTCHCNRCRDPTELKSYISALKCLGEIGKDCGGTLLPIDPLSPKTEWVCNTCPIRMDNEEVTSFLSNVEQEVDDTLMGSEKATVPKLENLINKLRPFLHPNHCHIWALKHSLVQLYGNIDPYTSEEYLKKKITMCNELLEVANILDPYSIRLSLYTPIILYELHLAEIKLFEMKINTVNIDECQSQFYLLDSKEHLTKCSSILQSSLDTPQAKKFYEKVIEAQHKLDEHLTLLKMKKIEIAS